MKHITYRKKELILNIEQIDELDDLTTSIEAIGYFAGSTIMGEPTNKAIYTRDLFISEQLAEYATKLRKITRELYKEFEAQNSKQH